MKKLFLILFVLGALNTTHAQLTVKGKISDENSVPVIGASVYEKGTTSGTISDQNGHYSLRVSGESAILVFSYVGYEKQEIKAGGQAEINVTLRRGADLKAVEIVGSRRPNRTSTETPAAVDIIDVSQLKNSAGQADVNQLLQYVAPSFNSNKQSGADGADHIDPATLRGLGPDQTLVLINGKRRHQSSLINIFGTRGRGNNGTDLNAIPASAIDHIEILRDGASAQYGSDAIAGVINIVLKDDVDEFSANMLAGGYNAKPPSQYAVIRSKNYDGQTVGADANYGFKAGGNGFINFTLDYLNKFHTNRPVDPAVYDVYREQYGDAASENFGMYFNSSFESGTQSAIYAFGGYNYRFTDAYAFTRVPDEDRNIPAIYPNGFNPQIQSSITDKSMSIGTKTKSGKWNFDVNNTFGQNTFHFFVNNTLNASLLEKSPTRFDAGGFSLLQNTSGINVSRFYDNVLEGLNFASGAEYRVENYKIFAGDEGSYKNYGGYFVFDVTDSLGNVIGQDSTLRPGGSQGFPGFQPANELNESRSNIGVYADAELDVTKALLISGAARFERYSDFGNTVNGKFAARVKINDNFSLRGSVSSGFRAPSLAQLYYNTTFTDFVAGQAVDKIIARNNSPITRALGIPALKQEKSVNASGGVIAKYKSFTATIDGYFVKIDDRIVLTGSFYDDDPEIGADLQKLNVAAAQFFTNAVNTTTKGVDVILTHTKVFANDMILKTSLAGNFNDMTIDKIFTNDKLKGKERIYFGIREQYFLLASAPKSKISLSFDYSIRDFFATLRFTQFGKVDLINFREDYDEDPNTTGNNKADPSEIDTYKAKITTDISLGYKFKNFQVSVGAQNAFNVYPDEHDAGWTESGGNWDAVQMGFSGAFYFAKAGFRF